MRLILLLFGSARILLAADSGFILEAHGWSPYTPAYVGSGLVSLSSTRLGTEPAQSFMAGVYDHANHDVPRIALLPSWNWMDVFNGAEWLNGTSSVRDYRQTLDMERGLLVTAYEWVAGGRETGVRVTAFVSRAEPDSAVVQLELTPRFSGTIRVRLPLMAWLEPKRYPLEQLHKLEGPAKEQKNIWYPGQIAPRQAMAKRDPREGLLQMTGNPEGMTTLVAEAAALDANYLEIGPGQDEKRLSPLKQEHIGATHSAGLCMIEISFTAAAYETYVFDKYVAFASSLSTSNPLERATRQAERMRSRGYRAALAEHRKAWSDLWQADIRVDERTAGTSGVGRGMDNGAPDLQRAIHAALFYLLCSATAKADYSIPPMGLSTAGYYGHIFWDADTFMFPALMALHPDIAKSLVMFRYKTLDAARKNAKKNGRLGAMYPWEAGPDGEETTPRFAGQNALYENHVNGDVALAAWQYFEATGDRIWLAAYGYPIIRHTADFWTSRAIWNRARSRYEIHGVVSVDESKIGVTDDPYTNAAAKKNLELAADAARILGKTANPKWTEVAQKLYLPGKDMLLIDYPLELPVGEAARRVLVKQAIDDTNKRHFGAMMGVEFRPIPAVETGDRAALEKLLDATWRPYMRPPFDVLPETPSNDNINFITGAGAFLQQFIFGYAGLRFSARSGLSRRFAPLLPESIRKLELRNISIRGRRETITVDSRK